MATREETIQQLLDSIHTAGATASSEELAYLGKAFESVNGLGDAIQKVTNTPPTTSDSADLGYLWWGH